MIFLSTVRIAGGGGGGGDGGWGWGWGGALIHSCWVVIKWLVKGEGPSGGLERMLLFRGVNVA